MIPSDHFVLFYNEVFKYLESCGESELKKYYDRVSKNQEFHCLELFKTHGLKGMYEYWEHIRIEENCDMVNHLTDDCYSFEFFSCPSLKKNLDNDAGACWAYCRHCPGWILPIMTKAGFFTVYNLIDCKVPKCEMYVYRDRKKAENKYFELSKIYPADVLLTNFDRGENE